MPDSFDEKQIGKLKRLMSVFDDEALTKEDFVKSFEEVIKLVVKVEEGLIDKINSQMEAKSASLESLKQEHTKAIADLKTSNDSTFGGIRQRLKENVATLFTQADVKGQLDAVLREVEGKMAEIDAKLGEMDEEEVAEDEPEETPEEIRDSLESLTGDERIDASAIKGLEEYGRRLGAIENRPRGDVMASRAGRVVYYDLSSKLDGTTVTYQLPAFWTVISVSLSSTPNVLRPTIDFTIDGSLMQITFTNQITPAVQLAVGQSCVVVYQEA